MSIRAGHWSLHGFGVFAVEKKSSGELIGWCGLRHPIDTPELELMHALARPHQRNGYATQAARAALAWGFETLRQPHVTLYIRPENAPSIRVAERLGACLEDNTEIHGSNVLVHRCHPVTLQPVN
jgi:RimJ/RimL family protein N-acetyltransferase